MQPALGDLYDERDFLLRSLDDLERERADDDIDDGTYERLRDDYTARAAAVLRAIDSAQRSGESTGGAADRRPRSTARAITVVAGMLVFVVVAGVLLANALGDRTEEGTATGNEQTAGDTAAATREALEDAVDRNPDDPEAQLELARFLAPTDPPAALEAYDRVVALDPTNVEAHAYGGWIVFLADLPEEALERVDTAVELDPAFADAHFFRGMILLRGMNDPDAAVAEFDRYLELSPDGPLADQVRQVATEARAAASQG